MDKAARAESLWFSFRRQAPIGRYIVDFVSFGAQLVIEIDGGQHGMKEGFRSDRVRDAFLVSRGFSVLRFWNSDVDRNLSGVMEYILNAMNKRDPHPGRLTPVDPPRKGEG